MSGYDYDVVVIGGGPGGYVAAVRAAQLGLKAACIDKNETLGGTCLNIGCIPSKALLFSSHMYDWLQHEASHHGIASSDASFNFDQMMKRKEEVVTGLVTSVASLLKRYQVDWLKGEGVLQSDPHQVAVNGIQGKRVVTAANIILATGSEPIPLPFLPFDESKILSSTGALSLKSVPKRFVLIGAGVIGVELASVYKRLGSEVTVIEMLDRICPTMDRAISRGFLQVLKKQGITFHLNSRLLKAESIENVVRLTYQSNEAEASLEADAVLVAIGRRPYSKGVGLENVGLKPDSKGFLPVDNNFRTAVPSIFAIGDLIDGPMLAHRASEEAVALANLLAGMPAHVNYMAIPNVVYTDPEVAAVGLTEEEANEMGLEIMIGTSYFKGNARARATGETSGFVKVIGDKPSGRLIGLHIIGSQASEMIGEAVLAIEKQATVSEVAYASHAHPTLAETIKEACFDALGKPLHG